MCDVLCAWLRRGIYPAALVSSINPHLSVLIRMRSPPFTPSTLPPIVQCRSTLLTALHAPTSIPMNWRASPIDIGTMAAALALLAGLVLCYCISFVTRLLSKVWLRSSHSSSMETSKERQKMCCSALD